MATNFPSSLDTSTTIPAEGASTTLSTNHVTAHQNIQDAIEIIEAKVGADSSAVTTSHDYKLSGVTGSDKALKSGTSTQSVTGLTLVTPKITVGSDAVGDLHYVSNVDGTLSRLAKGTDNQILKMNGTALNWEAETTVVAATEAVEGISRLATAAQINAGTASEASYPLVVTPDQLATSNYINNPCFGDGSDGNVTISGTTTLTSDMNYNDLTINSSQILNTANFRVFVKGTLTNNGTIRCNGVDATTRTGTSAVAAGTMLGGGAGGAPNSNKGGSGGSGAGVVFVAAKIVAVQGAIEAIGGAGNTGIDPAGATGVGLVGGSVTRSVIQSATGGAGGTCVEQYGGAGGVITTSSKMSRGVVSLLTLMHDGVAQLGGGGGGGGGSERNTSTTSGGGGGGQGGVIVFIYKTLTTAGTTTVTGGAGGAGFGAGGSGVSGGSGLVISIAI